VSVDPVAIKHFEMALFNCRSYDSAQYSVHDSINSVHDLLAAMSRMDYIVTCRFHGVVFAHLLNKPVLAIAHHPKVTDLMTDLGLSNYCVDIQEFDPRLLRERFAAMIVNTDEIKGRMAATLTKNRQRLGRQFDELFNI